MRLRQAQGALRQAQDDELVAVQPDPRAHWSQEQYVARYRFLRELNDELSSIDTALNHLDALRSHVSNALRKQIDGVYGQLTSGVVNSEDDLLMPDRVRERITILQGDVALSQGPPLPPHLREAAAIRVDYGRAMAAYNQLLTRTGSTTSEGRK
jgi:hypothetical protein